MSDENPFAKDNPSEKDNSSEKDDLEKDDLEFDGVVLTVLMQEYLDKNWKKEDLMTMVRKIFRNEKLDGRCKEGRAVTKYLASKGFHYKTSKFKKRDEIVFTDDQVEFIINQAKLKSKPMSIARIVFGDNNLHQFSKESLAVQRVIRETNPSLLASDNITDEAYRPPKTFKQATQKINEVTHENLDPAKVNVRLKKGIEKLLEYVHSPRFIQTATNLQNMRERTIFEAEFVRATWDKPDLSTDEINLYINLINEYIIQDRIQCIVIKLNGILEETTDDEDGKISMALSDSIKGKNEEYNQSVNRQNRLVTDLTGKRSARVNNRVSMNHSLVALVEAFQEKEERQNMIRLADLRRRANKTEVKEMENMDGFIVRIFGISEEEALD